MKGHTTGSILGPEGFRERKRVDEIVRGQPSIIVY
jgi:hypothetical protein